MEFDVEIRDRGILVRHGMAADHVERCFDGPATTLAAHPCGQRQVGQRQRQPNAQQPRPQVLSQYHQRRNSLRGPRRVERAKPGIRGVVVARVHPHRRKQRPQRGVGRAMVRAIDVVVLEGNAVRGGQSVQRSAHRGCGTCCSNASERPASR